MSKPQPWKPADATDEIRRLGRNEGLKLSYTEHAKRRLLERDLFVGDARYVLKNGVVLDDWEPATRPGLYKYRVECRTPNSNNRTVRIVVIPHSGQCEVKIVTVMWVDEP